MSEIDGTAFDVFFITANSVTLLIQCVLLGSLVSKLYAIYTSNNETHEGNAFKFPILYWTAVVCNSIMWVIASLSGPQSAWSHFMLFLAPFDYCCTYLVLLHRLSNTFADSIYAPKSYQITMHYVNLSTVWIAYITYFAILLAVPDANTVSLTARVIFVCCLIAMFTAGYAHLLYAFNHNLFLLVLNQRQSILHSRDDSTGQTSVELNERQKLLLVTVRKHSILGIWLVSSNLILMLSMAMGAMSASHGIGYLVMGLLLQFGAFNGMPFCIFLGLSFNQKMYNFCCKVCDVKCTTICIRITERKITKSQDAAKQLRQIQSESVATPSSSP